MYLRIVGAYRYGTADIGKTDFTIARIQFRRTPYTGSFHSAVSVMDRKISTNVANGYICKGILDSSRAVAVRDVYPAVRIRNREIATDSVCGDGCKSINDG